MCGWWWWVEKAKKSLCCVRARKHHPHVFHPLRLHSPPSTPPKMALTGIAKTVVDILLVIFLPPLAVFLVRQWRAAHARLRTLQPQMRAPCLILRPFRAIVGRRWADSEAAACPFWPVVGESSWRFPVSRKQQPTRPSPPIPTLQKDGSLTTNFWISLLLTLFAWIPGQLFGECRLIKQHPCCPAVRTAFFSHPSTLSTAAYHVFFR